MSTDLPRIPITNFPVMKCACWNQCPLFLYYQKVDYPKIRVAILKEISLNLKKTIRVGKLIATCSFIEMNELLPVYLRMNWFKVMTHRLLAWFKPAFQLSNYRESSWTVRPSKGICPCPLRASGWKCPSNCTSLSSPNKGQSIQLANFWKLFKVLY